MIGELAPAFRQRVRSSQESPEVAGEAIVHSHVIKHERLPPEAAGRLFYVPYEASTMGLRHVQEDAIRRPPFWRLLGAAARRVAVVDAPKWGADRSLNGFQLANWGAQATRGKPASIPDSLLRDVR
jgi:hypothetical protein